MSQEEDQEVREEEMIRPLEIARYEACKKAYLPKWIRDRYEIVLENGKVRLKRKNESIKETDSDCDLHEEVDQAHAASI
jgi:hypothetical protein